MFSQLSILSAWLLGTLFILMVPATSMITIVSNNILDHVSYQQGCVASPHMPLKERTIAFKRFMHDFCHDADIIAFQEAPIGPEADQEQLESWINTYATDSNNFILIRPPVHTGMKRTPMLMLNKKSSWEIVGTCTFATFLEYRLEKCMLIQILQHKTLQCDTTTYRLGVVSVHMPWAEDSATRKQLFNCIGQELDKFSGINGWIICGDFNFDIWWHADGSFDHTRGRHQTTIAYEQSIQNFLQTSLASTSYQAWNAVHVPEPTSFGYSGSPPDYEHIDHLFFSSCSPTCTLHYQNLFMYPTKKDLTLDDNALMRHHDAYTKHTLEGKVETYYHSDHAALKATFIIKSA